VINKRYVNDPDVHAPGVTLNALGIGWTANDFMHHMTGCRRCGNVL
jgi:hypothetical protein